MQAGAMGLPAIVTNINGCNEIIISGENGEIIPPHDEHALLEVMSKWMSNPDKVKHMASRSRELIVSRFEQKVVWEELLKEYKMLLNEIGIL
jgi:glycosyltransferase involved in cell wall biosynthesis